MLLRIGEARDLLVALNVDSVGALDKVRRLFGAWLEPDPALAVGIEPAFGLILEGAKGERGAGPRSVPQLRHGSSVVMRSRGPEAVFRALALVLGGAHVSRRGDGQTWMGLRPFVRGESVVLVDAARPALVNDPQLAKLDIDELPVWSVVAEPDGSVSVPPPLPELAWPSLGITAPDPEWRTLHLAGIAVLQHDDCTLAEVVADLSMRSTGAAWFATVTEAADVGRVECVSNRPAMRTAIERLLKKGVLAEHPMGIAAE